MFCLPHSTAQEGKSLFLAQERTLDSAVLLSVCGTQHVVTDITMAAMEDTGWYLPQYETQVRPFPLPTTCRDSCRTHVCAYDALWWDTSMCSLTFARGWGDVVWQSHTSGDYKAGHKMRYSSGMLLQGLMFFGFQAGCGFALLSCEDYMAANPAQVMYAPAGSDQGCVHGAGL